MIIKVREKDYEAPPFPYKKWIELEEKGLDIESVIQKKKDCPVCMGKKKIDGKNCKACKGDGKVLDISKREIYTLIEVVLVYAGVPQETVDALTVGEVGELMPQIINFTLAKE